MVNKFFRFTTLFLAAVTLPFMQLVLASRAFAASSNVVISEVATEAANASQEFIELYNNSQTDVSLNGWVLQLRSSNNALNRTIILSDTLKGRSYALLASTNHEACSVSDFPCFSSTMASTGGHVVLIDSNSVVVDKVAWGPAVDPENIAAALPTATTSLTRKATANLGVLQDTDHNADDFQLSSHSPNAGGMYTPAPVVDVCPNLDGLQETMPAGYELSGGNCQLIVVPDPDPKCQGISITEILPNPAGDDTGHEFIELFNETSGPVDLTGCILKVGTSSQVLSGIIDSGYRAFYGLTLPNSAGGQVSFVTNTEAISVTYPANIGDDEAYGFVDGAWQAGLTATPGTANVALSPEAQAAAEEDELESCGPGKYRNPDTNRCRNIEAESSLTPCDTGQVRNPETNRCRNASTGTATLTPCSPGETRNPDTNRCRKETASESNLTPCKEGQERSPETNRCRNVASAKSTNPMAQPAKAASKPVSYYVLGVVAALGVAYGAYEYRHSISNFFTKRKQKA